MSSSATSTDPEIRRLIAGEHSDPHHLLGPHPHGSGVRLRVWRPGARAVRAELASGQVVELTQADPAGLFEADIAGATMPLAYELLASYADGGAVRGADPYAYAPTIGELDLHLVGEGRHEELYRRMGAHHHQIGDLAGVAFAVWAPNARRVSVVGDFNSWDGRINPMRSMGASGIWELFVPGLKEPLHYKFELLTAENNLRVKADPFAFKAELPPGSASQLTRPRHRWADQDWMARRALKRPHEEPLSIYEVHLGSWRRTLEGGELSANELAGELASYVKSLGFTHVELLPVMGHPFTGSWGYQVTSYFAPTPRLGEPDDVRALIDRLHREGVGVLLDWVPAHFPRDDWALARFDGSALYEHEDPRRGTHPDWGTLVFNFARNEVRNFLLANALFWLEEFHADGLRVDAVASMLYRDYSRPESEWLPNQFGGREDLEAVAFLKELNELVHLRVPGVISAAEESTAWPGVSRPTYAGGLGFDFKWNMGWMHDTLEYFSRDPVYRRWSHNELTFSLVYAFSENFILPLSHDEVVHGKRSLLEKMPGDRWQRLANLRALYGYMWAHPGKKLLFMGQEFAQEREWNYEHSLDWHLLEHPEHAGVQALVSDLNRLYRRLPALWERDSDPAAFWWLEVNDAASNVIAFVRTDAEGSPLVCVCNLSPVVRVGYRVGLPRGGRWVEALNTDSSFYGGSNVGNAGEIIGESVGWHGQEASAEITLGPLAVLWLLPEGPHARGE